MRGSVIVESPQASGSMKAQPPQGRVDRPDEADSSRGASSSDTSDARAKIKQPRAPMSKAEALDKIDAHLREWLYQARHKDDCVTFGAVVEKRHDATHAVSRCVKRPSASKTLSFSSFRLRSLPRKALGLIATHFEPLVQGINLDFNRLTRFPVVLCQFRYMQAITLFGNRGITEIPEGIKHLKQLAVIKAQMCSIQRLPDSLSKLSKMKELLLSNNQLSTIPDLSKLKALRVLHLDENYLTDELYPKLPLGLTRLGLSRNRFTAIPAVVHDMPDLSFLNLENNGFHDKSEWEGLLTYVDDSSQVVERRYEFFAI